MAIETYYTSQQEKLLRDFDRNVKVIRAVLVTRYGDELAEQLIYETRQEYQQLIRQLPFIGGKQYPLTWNLVSSAWFLAVYRVLKARGKTVSEIGALCYEIMETWMKRYPAFLMRLMGWWRFTRWYWNQLEQRARLSQERRYPEDFVYAAIKGDGKTFDFGVDYTECALCKFYHAQDADEFTPYLCPLDIPMTKALGIKLTRTMTLAEGAPRCDFRFKRA